MVTTVKTWTATLNNNLGSVSDQLVQYQTAMFNFVDKLLLAGWEVTWSTDGTQQGATNYWTSASTILVAAPGVAHSMIILQAPVAWGNPTSGNRYHLFLSCEDSAPSPNPNDFYFIFAPSTITCSSTTTKPTSPTSSDGAVASTARLLNWTTVGAGRASYWHTTSTYQGDAFIFTKLTTSNYFTQGFAVIDPIYARGNNRGLVVFQSSSALLELSGSLVGCSAANATSTSTSVSLNFPSVGNWTDGKDASGAVGYWPIFVTNNGAGQLSRYFGYLPDIWGSSATAAENWNYNDTSDLGSVVLRGLNGVGLPVPSTAPALE